MQPSLKLSLLFSLTVFSCATNDRKQEATETQIPSAYTGLQVDTARKPAAKKTPSPDTDTLTIGHKAAVFYQPDSLQIEKRMKEVGEENFRAGMDDYIYSINTSVEYLQKQGLTVIDAKNKKYIKFVFAEVQTQLIKLDTLEELWGIYLFEPRRKPLYVDMTMIEEEYKNYFK